MKNKISFYSLFFYLLFQVSYSQSSSQKFTVENNQLKLPSAIIFYTGTDSLKPESDDALAFVKEYLEAKTYITLLRIENHTSSFEDETSNQFLSEKRASAVVRWLVNHGIDCTRLLAVGFGNTKPIANTSTPEGRAMNNRTLFCNAALRGRLIGGMPADGGGKIVDTICK